GSRGAREIASPVFHTAQLPRIRLLPPNYLAKNYKNRPFPIKKPPGRNRGAAYQGALDWIQRAPPPFKKKTPGFPGARLGGPSIDGRCDLTDRWTAGQPDRLADFAGSASRSTLAAGLPSPSPTPA